MNALPALDDFHSVHKVHVLVLALDLCHDHCSRCRVKLGEETKAEWCVKS